MGQEDEVIEQTGEADVQNSGEVIEENPTDAGDTVIEGEEVQPAEPAFTPDYKFRANQQDMEIPEEFRSHIKDAESQKKVKEIFEKYHGFDTQKTKVSALEQDVNKYRGDFESIVGNLQGIQADYKYALDSGNLHNLDPVLEKLGLGEDVLMAWAIEKAKLQAMEKPERDAVLHRNKLEHDAYLQGQQQNFLMTQNQQYDLRIRQMQFDSAMATPQITSFASELDNKFGRAGLFAEEVKRAGEMAYVLENKTLSVEEAMQAVITKYGLKGAQVAPAQSQVQGNANGQKAAAGNVTADGKKIIQRDTKVIPNVGSSSGTSPIGAPKAKNLDDVRKRYAELAAQG